MDIFWNSIDFHSRAANHIYRRPNLHLPSVSTFGMRRADATSLTSQGKKLPAWSLRAFRQEWFADHAPSILDSSENYTDEDYTDEEIDVRLARETGATSGGTATERRSVDEGNHPPASTGG